VSSANVAMGLVLLASLSMGLISCTHSPTPNAVKPNLLKAKKPLQHPLYPEVPEDENGIDYYATSSLSRNLPLAGTSWEWEGDLKPQVIENLNSSSVYTLEFKSNGWFEIQSDCRHGSGMYESHAGHIALTVIKFSPSVCHSESQADDFVKALESARTYRLNDGKLFLDIKHQTEPLVFHLKP